MKNAARLAGLALGIPLLIGATHARVRDALDPLGCYLATPPLPVAATATTATATPTLVTSLDTARAIIAIEADGVLRRPKLSREARMLGGWVVRGDSLHAWFSDGFTGWRYRLGATTEGWQGFAEYLTDELSPDNALAPLRRPAMWIRHACP